MSDFIKHMRKYTQELFWYIYNDKEINEMIDKIKADSSNLDVFWYNKDTKVLTIEFKNGTAYEYSNVSPKVFEGLKTAESQGRYFHKNIRGVFLHKKLKKEGNCN